MLEELEKKLAAVEKKMKADLEEARASSRHSGSKGYRVEEAFRKFLRDYLPRRLDVGHGEIVDLSGKWSSQTDVIISNEDHPFVNPDSINGPYFIEGVSGVGEVKSTLTSGGLEKVIKGSCKFKQLRIDPGQGSMAKANSSDLERFYKCPTYFLFAWKSDLTLPTIREKIIRAVEENNISNEGLVDAVFILDRGWLINLGDGKGSFKSISPEGKSLPGWIPKESDRVLFDLLAWLSTVMPRIIRFDPILPGYMLKGPAAEG